jgi:hypothetical protein
VSTMELLNKEYDGESLSDITRDVTECFDTRFSPDVIEIPVDEHNLPKGIFKVVITWVPVG